MIFGMTYYQICMYFMIYSFAGWVMEVIFHAVSQRKVINRGFLNGPVCPVYGIGVLGVFALGNTLEAESGAHSISVGLLFLIGVLLATAVELLAGWLLDVCFHARWWDYSNRAHNFKGYICLQFSLIWGAGIVVVIKVAQPLVERHTVQLIPEKIGWPVMGILYSLFLADLIVTVAVVQGMNRKLKELDEIRASMRIVSNGLSDVLAKNSIRTAQAVEEGRAQTALATAELKESVAGKAAEMREAVTEKAVEMKETVSGKAVEMKDAVTGKAAGVKESVAGKAAEMKDAVTGKAAGMKESVAGKAVEMKDAVTGKAVGMKETVSGKAGKTMEELEDRAEAIYQQLLKARVFGARRILEAFPNMRHHHYAESFRQLKEKLISRKNRG
ncbi:MAG: hypothetical protein IIY55_07030 [Blautia sp.]|nr:hypothetical protein [Blautia sp.]